MPTLYLLIGSNQGDRRQMITQATDLIRERIGSVVACSHVYETSPWGTFADGGNIQSFYNQALEVETRLTPHKALNEAQRIERLLGRRRKVGVTGYTSRPIDVDLIFYDTLVIDTPDLVLPHPRMHLRRFVLEPMCDIAPDFIHPLLNKTLKELLDECTDTLSCCRCC